MAEPKIEAPPASIGPMKRVLWTDGTLRRQGWRCQHVSIGGSLRSIQTDGAAFAQTMFVARQDLPSYEPADTDTRRVVDVWTKILGRGCAPPIHPAAERQLLADEGFGPGDLRPPDMQGDLAPRLVKLHKLSLAAPFDTDYALDSLYESDAEESFAAWLSKSHPKLVSFLTPQASFGMLLTARGHETKGARRVDFLFALPDGSATVVEIDGPQHRGQVPTDGDRDSLLAQYGISTIRVTTQEVERGKGPNLQRVSELAGRLGPESRSSGPINSLAWTPILLHRLAFGLGEAITSGFLAGRSWVISLDDPTQRLASLLGPYLQMFWALDRLWSESSLAPEQVTVITRYGRFGYELSDNGEYLRCDGQDWPADVHIQLEIDKPPAAELVATAELATIIIRTASIGVSVSRLPTGGSSRIPARTEIGDTKTALTALLRAIFAKADFRSGQYQAVAELIASRDCCVLLPTGAGKSIIYQLAGLCLPGRTLIVDPIVALIEDQIVGLKAHGIDRAIGITAKSTQQGQTKGLLRDVADADAYFIFVAPERLQMSNFRNALKELAIATPINLAVIDEAHCVSEWGHNFRTSYLGLGKVIRNIAADAVGRPPPLVALTGTASRAVLRDVMFQLEIEEQNNNTIVRPDTFDRKELNYQIVRGKPDTAEVSLRSVLKTLPSKFNESPQTFYHPDGERTFSGLSFVPTVNGRKNGLRGTKKIVSDVCSSVEMYSGGPPKGFNKLYWERIKREHADGFKQNNITALVCTSAFGMGIDKPNIRWVVHAGLSGSIESYYQEVGRAGRNGQRAQCVLILSEFDQARNSQLLAEDVNLEDARTRSNSLNWGERDDVTTALWFHFNSFPGIDGEVDALAVIVDKLKPSNQKQQVEVPFARDKGPQERALHRLIILGVVEEYLVEFGSNKFVITVEGSNPEKVKRSLLAFVERTQPGRVEEMRTRLHRTDLSHYEAIVQYGRTLIEFVYETVERSRRRSLREMLLSARHSDIGRDHSDTGEEFRNRILAYLSEGDVGKMLEGFVDAPVVDFERWTEKWAEVKAKSDAAEWRAASARLLASYPDHPGLLISRGLSELLVTIDEQVTIEAINEYVLNIDPALLSAITRYNVPAKQVREDLISWLVEAFADKSSAAVAVTVSVAAKHKVAGEDARDILKQLATTNIAAAIVYIDLTLTELSQLAENIITGNPR